MNEWICREERGIRPERQSLSGLSRKQFPPDNSSSTLMKGWLQEAWLRRGIRDETGNRRLISALRLKGQGSPNEQLFGGKDAVITRDKYWSGENVRKKYPDLSLLQHSVLLPGPPIGWTQLEARGHESRREKVGEWKIESLAHWVNWNWKLFLFLLRYNGHITLYEFKVYNLMIRYLYTLWNDHHNKSR